MTWQQTIDEEKDMAFEEGMKQGIERGVYRAKIDDAKAMLADGLSLAKISEYVGLPEDVLRGEILSSQEDEVNR